MKFDHMTLTTSKEAPSGGLSTDELKAIADKIVSIADDSGILERCGYTADYAKSLYAKLVDSDTFHKEYIEFFKMCSDEKSILMQSTKLPLIVVEQCNAAKFNEMLKESELSDLLYGKGPDNEKDEIMVECLNSAIKLNGIILNQISPRITTETGDITPAEKYEMAIKYSALHAVQNITLRNPLAWTAIDVALNTMISHNIEFDESDFDSIDTLLKGFVEVFEVGKVNGLFPEGSQMEIAFMTTSLEKAIENNVTKEN